MPEVTEKFFVDGWGCNPFPLGNYSGVRPDDDRLDFEKFAHGIPKKKLHDPTINHYFHDTCLFDSGPPGLEAPGEEQFTEESHVDSQVEHLNSSESAQQSRGPYPRDKWVFENNVGFECTPDPDELCLRRSGRRMDRY